MKILISGICGHMGKILYSSVMKDSRGIEVACGVDPNAHDVDSGAFSVPVFSSFDNVTAPFDLIVDFSHHSATKTLLEYALNGKKPIVIATTGQSEEEKKLITSASEKIPVFFASNYSVGVAVLIKMAKIAVQALPSADIEIVESHHNRKVDSPSGTAVSIFNAVKSIRTEASMKCGRSGQEKRSETEVGMHSLRMADIVGRHEIHITTASEELVLRHEAFSREVFASGALNAALFLAEKSAGLYGMEDLLHDF